VLPDHLGAKFDQSLRHGHIERRSLDLAREPASFDSGSFPRVM